MSTLTLIYWLASGFTLGLSSISATPCCGPRSSEPRKLTMQDLLYIGLWAAFFAATAAMTIALRRL
jgi:hypothetical protein